MGFCSLHWQWQFSTIIVVKKEMFKHLYFIFHWSEKMDVQTSIFHMKVDRCHRSDMFM